MKRILVAAALVAAIVVTTGCGSKSTPPAEPKPAGACVTGGCSGTVCQDADAEPTMTTCEWRDEYACYRDAACERQADGACGWTQSESLTACLASPPAP
jgi:eight-cysteine-cluster-containing protein